MTAQVQYLQTTEEGVQAYRVGQSPWVEAPTFIPEIKGPEDLLVLLRNRRTLDPSNPILVPGARWSGIRTEPKFSDLSNEIQSLVNEHPLIYYEPPEHFRYSLPSSLVTHACRGSRSKRRKVNSALREGNHEKAIKMLPDFVQPFVECNLHRLLRRLDEEVPPEVEDDEDIDGRVVDAWRDSRADEGYEEYFTEIAKDASQFPYSALIPPVPPILQSTESDIRRRAVGANQAMATICQVVSEEEPDRHVRPFYHIYADHTVLSSGNDLHQEIIERCQAELEARPYAGVALTMTGYEAIWKKKLTPRLEEFVSSLASLATQHHVPFIAPRSDWHGLHLTDSGLHGFSGMLNSSEQYHSRGGGPGKKALYGKVPVPDHAVELSITELADFLEEHEHMPEAGHLPELPPEYSPSAAGVRGRFGTDNEFRVNFGKPWRLMHCIEARRMREGRKRGVMDPAKQYFDTSDHPYIGN